MHGSLRICHRLRVAVAVSMVLLSHPATADEAADKASARQLFHDAGQAMEAGDYEKSADLYGRSNAIFPAPTAALGEARALVKLGRLLDAHERYQALASTKLSDDASDAFKQAVKDAGTERALVVERIPALIIVVDGSAEVSLDGKALPAAALGVKRLVDPGKHVVVARASGRPATEREVTVVEGQVLEVPIHLAAAHPRAPVVAHRQPAERPTVAPSASVDAGEISAQRMAGLVLCSVGGAGLVVWAVTGIVYLKHKSVIDEQCDDQQLCSQEGLDAVERGRAIGLVNTVMFFGGLALSATGVTLVLTSSDDSTVALIPVLAPSAALVGIDAHW